MYNTDDILMSQFQKDDRDAFALLVHRHKEVIFRFILSKVRDKETAADLTQDVFVKLWKSANSYRQMGKFRSWLFRMAQNICIDFQRKNQKKSILSFNNAKITDKDMVSPDPIQDISDDAGEEAEWCRLQTGIERALEALPEEQRTALMLCQYHGMSYNEIAVVQKVPLGTVKSRIHHALIRVRDYFIENGYMRT